MLPSHGSPNIPNWLNSLESSKSMSSNGLDCRLSHIVFFEFFESFIRVKYCRILELAWSLDRPRDRSPGFAAPSAAAEIFPKLTNGSLSPVTQNSGLGFSVFIPFILPIKSKIVLIFIVDFQKYIFVVWCQNLYRNDHHI